MIRVGFPIVGTTLWYAGVTYLNNLFRALQHTQDVRRVLFAPPDAPPSLLAESRTLAHDVVQHPALHPKAPADERHAWMAEHVDVTFEIYGHHFNTPAPYLRIGWVTDFQHVHLGHLSQPHMVADRDAAIAATVAHADHLVVSSHDAERDLLAFAPEHCPPHTVLRFVAAVPDGVYSRDPLETVRHYHLPEKFIFLPNQFWKHKNHRVALEALAQLCAQVPDAFLVCSGNTLDHRDPLYFSGLLEWMAQADLRTHVALLGMVPGDRLWDLMRQSVCVLNPSLFEGWSTTVEEAKSLGKRVVLSDLPVHIEQDPPGAMFVPRDDPSALATALREVWATTQPGADTMREAVAREAFVARQRAYGATFASMVREVAGDNNQRLCG